jgi:hypothetical protein
MLIFGFVEIGRSCSLGRFDGLKFYQGTSLLQVYIDFLNISILLKVLM